MNSTQKPINRNTGSIIAKCLIVFVVLGIVCSLSIWAWFTMGQTAIADGINIKSKGDGVQVSWDGENYYDNLQALDDADVSEANGPALNISGDKGQPAPLSLVTGNGLQFFEPYLNRRTGNVLYDGNDKTKNWYGVDVVDGENSEGKYIDIDLYFRSDMKRDVYLAGDSKVSPKSTTERMSEYGNFSKDNIASASRVAFLNADRNECAFIWAPNSDYKLVEDDSGYTKYTTTQTEEITTSGGSEGVLDGGAVQDNKTYYLWTFRDDILIDTYPKGQDSANLEARLFTYDSKIKYYVTTVKFYVPTYEMKDPSIPIIINNSGNKSDLSSTDSTNIAGYDSLVSGKAQETNGQHFFVTNGEFNLDNGSIKCTNKMYADSQYIASGEYISIDFGYNPETNLLTILSYTANGGNSFTLNGQKEEVTITVKYFPLGDNINCTLINPLSSTAISTGVNYKKAVSFTDSNKNNVSNASITLSEQFTTVKSGTGYYATYKFKDSSNTYLTLNNGSVSLTPAGTEFTLEYKAGFSGPLLKAGNYYLIIDQGRVMGVEADALDTDKAFTVYTGATYDLVKVSSDAQPYTFYNNSSGKKTLETLSSVTTPKLFTTNSDTEASVKVGGTKIVSLTKSEGDEYYTAHIVMRVWVEGTDREAKTPLADGIFDMSLHFTSQ